MPSLFGMMRKHGSKHELPKKWKNWHFFIPSGVNKPKQDLSENEKKSQTNAKYKNIVKRKGQSKAKNQVKGKTRAKGKTQDKRKVWFSSKI